MENAQPSAVVPPGIVPQTAPPPDTEKGWFPLWSKWVDSKGKLWIIVGHSAYGLIDGMHTATHVHCLDVTREYEQIIHILDLRLSLKQGRLTRLTGYIIPQAILLTHAQQKTRLFSVVSARPGYWGSVLLSPAA